MLTPAAWNAFLKTLEEPPPHTIFVLATTEANKVLPTVVDRCHRFDFGRPSVPQIASVLRRAADSESIEIPDEAVALVARSATGSFRDALGTLEQLVAYSGTSIAIDDVLAVLGAADADLLFGTLDAVSAGDARSALLAAARLADSGRDLGRFFGDLEAHARGLMVTQVLGDVPAELRVTPEQDERLAEQAAPRRRRRARPPARADRRRPARDEGRRRPAHPARARAGEGRQARPGAVGQGAAGAHRAAGEPPAAAPAAGPAPPDAPRAVAARPPAAPPAGDERRRPPPRRRRPRPRAHARAAPRRPRAAPQRPPGHASPPAGHAGAPAAAPRPAALPAHAAPAAAPAPASRAAAGQPPPAGQPPRRPRLRRRRAHAAPSAAAPPSRSPPRSRGSRPSRSATTLPGAGHVTAAEAQQVADDAAAAVAQRARDRGRPDARRHRGGGRRSRRLARAAPPSLELSLDAFGEPVAGGGRTRCARRRRCSPRCSRTARPPRSPTTG